MAINTCIGFAWRQLIMNEISIDAWEYLAVCVPIVVIFAPLGSFVASHVHRLVLAWLIYLLEIVSLVGGYSIVRPEWPLGLTGAGIILVGFVCFYVMRLLGVKLTKRILRENVGESEKVSIEKLIKVPSGDVEACDEQNR